MKTFVFLVSLLVAFPLLAENEPIIVKLTIESNKQEKPAPKDVSIAIAGKVMRMTVQDGSFTVLPEIASARRVTFSADIGGTYIRLTNLPGKAFEMESWIIHLAEPEYPEGLRFMVPAEADTRTSCILELNSKRVDAGNLMFFRHCRGGIK